MFFPFRLLKLTNPTLKPGLDLLPHMTYVGLCWHLYILLSAYINSSADLARDSSRHQGMEKCLGHCTQRRSHPGPTKTTRSIQDRSKRCHPEKYTKASARDHPSEDDRNSMAGCECYGTGTSESFPSSVCPPRLRHRCPNYSPHN
jgi:hypothetical protein